MTLVSLFVIPSVLAPTAKGLVRIFSPQEAKRGGNHETQTEDCQREETGLSVRSLSPGQENIPACNRVGFGGGGGKTDAVVSAA